MKKTLFAAGAAAILFLATSCATLSTPAGVGALYTDINAGEAVTSNQLGKKVGTAKATNILGLIATGDASIETAAKQGGIKKISHIDSKKKVILGIYGTYDITVYGE